MITNLHSWEDLNGALLRLGQLELMQQSLSAEYETRQKDIKEEAQERIDPIIAEKALLEKVIRIWCEDHKPEIESEGARSRKLFWGTVGWIQRMSLKPIGKRTFAQILDQLWDAGKRRFIRISKELDKDGLKRWGEDHPEELKELGLTVKPIDNLQIKPDLAQIANYKPAA